MLRTIEAIIEPDGSVRLLQTVALPGTRRALITVLEESADEAAGDLTARLSEPMLTQEWDRPEEDAAWAHLQPGSVVLVPFPFSDLSQSKLRRAVMLADVSRRKRELYQSSGQECAFPSRGNPLPNPSSEGGEENDSAAVPSARQGSCRG